MPQHVFIRLPHSRLRVFVVVVVVVVLEGRVFICLFVCLFVLVYCSSTANNRLLHTYYL